jgi:hypothetical protein
MTKGADLPLQFHGCFYRLSATAMVKTGKTGELPFFIVLGGYYLEKANAMGSALTSGGYADFGFVGR